MLSLFTLKNPIFEDGVFDELKRELVTKVRNDANTKSAIFSGYVTQDREAHGKFLRPSTDQNQCSEPEKQIRNPVDRGTEYRRVTVPKRYRDEVVAN
jgi:hypothetical protein